jgi:hypothetical protein
MGHAHLPSRQGDRTFHSPVRAQDRISVQWESPPESGLHSIRRLAT